ncbi:monooxygenase FAD-binding protein [Trametes meyenii]|nr:monooxygenase FAD-binding protein [Trametes meyenii]
MSTNASALCTTPPQIAIIGGGPGGLVALLTLLKRRIPATLYERDTNYDVRAHLGGMLDLDYETGQRALRENGLEEEFKNYSRHDAEEMRVCGKDGVPRLRHDEEPNDNDLEHSRPEIDRRILRKILLDNIPADAIKWGHGLTSIRPIGGGQHELTFANGFLTTADYVIGADGAHSRIRPLLSPATPIYHGVTGAEISLPAASAALPENSDIRDAVGRGTCFLAQENKVLTFQKNGDGRIRAYAWHRNTLDWALPSDPKAAKEVLLEIYHDWAPWVRKFIQIADEGAVYPRPLFHLPVGHRWPHTPGVTIIGDAAHLMSPFAGAGANLAMRDGLDIGLALEGSVGKGLGAEEWEAAVKAWEEEMFTRVGQEAAVTARNLEAFVNADAPDSAIKAFELSVEGH